MKNIGFISKIIKQLLLISLVITTFGTTGLAREITDMAGRKVTIPDKPSKVYSPSPGGTHLLPTLAPELMGALVRSFGFASSREGLMIPQYVKNLPVIGGFSGEGQIVNLEMLMAVQPDLVIAFPAMKTEVCGVSASDVRMLEALERVNMPLVFVCSSEVGEYPAAYRFLGDILNRKERAEELAVYIERVLADADSVLAQVPPEKRPKVYYAQSFDGLNTVGVNSPRGGLLKTAGDVNVHRIKKDFSLEDMGYDKVSIELVMSYDPDIILVFDYSFYKKIWDDPAWKNLRAVKNKDVYLIPWAPLNWMDRPPGSFMQAMGLQWLLTLFYPEHYKKDIVQEAVEFSKLFFNYDITYDDMQKMIYPFAGQGEHEFQRIIKGE